MEFIKTQFSIKDLENLSGVKAHTIRIWEKRYELLAPERTETNIRYYSAKSLQKLLNIALLNQNGIKISKIAALSDQEIVEMCNGIIADSAFKGKAINNFKMAMFNFDTTLFQLTFDELSRNHDFEEIFKSYFVPFLEELGLLWQTDTISPAHEHFISALIKQKLLVEIERLQRYKPEHTKTKFILFLPDQEIHDLGLLYTHYLLLSRRFHSVYLGQSIPIENLGDFRTMFDTINFVSYFTVKPNSEKLMEYITKLHDKIVSQCDCNLWVMGRKSTELHEQEMPNRASSISSFDELSKMLNNLIKSEAS